MPNKTFHFKSRTHVHFQIYYLKQHFKLATRFFDRKESCSNDNDRLANSGNAGQIKQGKKDTVLKIISFTEGMA